MQIVLEITFGARSPIARMDMTTFSPARVVLLVVEGCREVHAGAEPKWIGVQHGFVLSQQLVGISEVSGGSVSAGRRIEPGQIMGARGHGLRCEPGYIVCIDGAVVLFVNEICLCIVFLFCSR